MNENSKNTGRPITLKQFRKKYGLTQKQLAEKTGTTPTTISMYENGRWIMNQYLLDQIREKYGENIRPLASTQKNKKTWQKRR